MKKIIAYLLVALTNFILAPTTLLAAEVPEPTVKITGQNGCEDIECFYKTFVKIMNWVFAFAIVIAVIMIIWGGVAYMSAGGDEKQSSGSKQRIVYGVVGVAIIVGAWTIVRLVGSLIGVEVADPGAAAPALNLFV